MALPQLEHWPSSSCSPHPPTPPPGSTWGGLVEKASDAPPLLAAWGGVDDIGGSALIRSMTRQVLAQCRRSPEPRRHKRAPRHAPPAPRPVHRHAGGGPQKPPPRPLWYVSARACCWPVESHGRHEALAANPASAVTAQTALVSPFAGAAGRQPRWRQRTAAVKASPARRVAALLVAAATALLKESASAAPWWVVAPIGGRPRRPVVLGGKWKSNARVRGRQCLTRLP